MFIYENIVLVLLYVTDNKLCKIPNSFILREVSIGFWRGRVLIAAPNQSTIYLPMEAK